MKKGFTLAELIGVLVILALIGMIAIPSVTKTIKNNKSNICIIQFNNIIEEAKGWASNNIDKLPTTNGAYSNIDECISNGYCTTVTFNDLVKYGYTEDNLIDPITKEKFSDSWYVKIEKINNKLDYKIYNGTEWIDPEKYCK